MYDEPAFRPTNEITNGRRNDPTVDPTERPTQELALLPTNDPANEPTHEPSQRSAGEPEGKSSDDPAHASALAAAGEIDQRTRITAEFVAMTLFGSTVSYGPPAPDSMLAWFLAQPDPTRVDARAEWRRRGFEIDPRGEPDEGGELGDVGELGDLGERERP